MHQHYVNINFFEAGMMLMRTGVFYEARDDVVVLELEDCLTSGQPPCFLESKQRKLVKSS